MNYAVINKTDIANGSGIRVSIFVSGCNFHCKNCFNLVEQDFNYGKLYTADTKQSILNLVNKPYVKGLSILGGDPLWQNESGMMSLIDLCQNVHTYDKTVWIWSGFTWEEIFPVVTLDNFDSKAVIRQELIRNCDVWIDGRFNNDLKDSTLKWRGSSNQRVIDVQKSLKENKIILYCD